MLTAVSTHACIAESLIAGARSLMPFFRVQTSGELSSSPQYHTPSFQCFPFPAAHEQRSKLSNFSQVVRVQPRAGTTTRQPAGRRLAARSRAGFWRGRPVTDRRASSQAAQHYRPLRPLVCMSQ